MDFHIRENLAKLKKDFRTNLEKDGHLAPVLFLNINGNLTIMPALMEDENDKGKLSNLILTLVKNGTLKEYAMAAESWMAYGPEVIEHKKKGLSLEFLPDRMEVITFVYASPNLEIFEFAEINRDSEKPVLGEWISDKCDPRQIGSFPILPPRFNYLWQQVSVGVN